MEPLGGSNESHHALAACNRDEIAVVGIVLLALATAPADHKPRDHHGRHQGDEPEAKSAQQRSDLVWLMAMFWPFLIQAPFP